jgi:protein TonB
MKKILLLLVTAPAILFSQNYVESGGKLVRLNKDFTWEYVNINKEVVVDDILTLEEDISDVPFSIVEDVPLFPGCETIELSGRRKCFQEKIQQHIADNFRYPSIAQEMGIQGRVYVQFIIDRDGTITGIRTRGPDKNLEFEANRIISKLPRMTPGMQRGKPVRVPFSIPIIFSLN